MNRSKKIFELLEQKGRNKAVDIKGKTADKLSALIDEKETLELYDIMEEAEGTSEVEELISNNIEFLIEREVGKGKVSLVSAEVGGSSKDKLLGTYDVNFKDNSTYGGNFVADGIQEGEKFELDSLTIGSEELKYFGI